MNTTLQDALWAVAIIVLGVSVAILGVLVVARYADQIALHLNTL